MAEADQAERRGGVMKSALANEPRGLKADDRPEWPSRGSGLNDEASTGISNSALAQTPTVDRREERATARKWPGEMTSSERASAELGLNSSAEPSWLAQVAAQLACSPHRREQQSSRVLRPPGASQLTPNRESAI